MAAAPTDTDPRAREILDRAVEAHGGAETWTRMRELRIELSIGGLALASKGCTPAAMRLKTRIDPKSVRVEMAPYRGGIARLDGWKASVLDRDGNVTHSLDVAHDAEGQTALRRLWQPVHHVFFFGYAIWNYALTPWLLTQSDMRSTALEPLPWRGAMHERVRVRFPADLPTHCREQDFWFAPDGRLSRLDYTAHVLSRFAHGAHEVDRYELFDGVPFATRRRVWVRPTAGTFALRAIPVMAGTVHHVEWDSDG